MKKLATITSLLFVSAYAGYCQTPEIYGPDGTYLGNLSSNIYDPNSINNPWGRYGNPNSADSIWNPWGQYGNPNSPKSPWNPWAGSQKPGSRLSF